MDLLLIIIPFILILASQAYIKNSYKKYEAIDTRNKINGFQVAREILDNNDLSDVNIKRISGTLTDNYNPKDNTIYLSTEIYSESSIASVAVAAHESCHVIQHKNKYIFIVLRSFLVPVVNITSKLGYIILIVGILASYFDIAMIGLILMGGALIFQLITLPTEYNASNNAKKQLIKLGIITKGELPLVKSMLNAAALTYLASFFASFLQMLRLFLNINRRN